MTEPAEPPGRGPELRLDPLTREWVMIVGERQHRPNLPAAGCPFCVGGLEAPEPYDVHAFTNRWPALVPGEPITLGAGTLGAGTLGAGDLGAGDLGAGADTAPARGAAEVVLYTPDHDASLGSLGATGIRKVVDLWAERTTELHARPEVEYVLVFENRGRDVGATIDHPHGQIYAFGFVPPIPRRELEVSGEHGCPLCTLAPGEAAARSRVVVDDRGWVAWVPAANAWPYGTLLAPRAHVDGLATLDGAGRDALASALADVLTRYDRLFARPFPYMLWIHQQPGDERAHLHLHVAPPRRTADTLRYVASGELGSGTYSNPVVPEAAAQALRDA
jgi:UDPglucose--hexose-1-phosphate uridylyltransferase